MFRWQCWTCGAEFTATTPGTVITAGRDHLLDQHRSEVETRLRGRLVSDLCRGGCGYRFSSEGTSATDFECPQCGYDNLPEVVEEQIWSEVTKQ